MAGAIHKMAVYLGLVEDEVAYEDGYDSFEEDYAGYEDEETAGPDLAARRRQRRAAVTTPTPASRDRPLRPGAPGRRSHPDHDPASAHIQ